MSEDISEEDKATVESNMEALQEQVSKYRDSIVDHYDGLYSAAAALANKQDDLLNFYFDLYGHVDANFR